MFQHKSLKEMGDEAQRRLWEKERQADKQAKLEAESNHEIASLKACGVTVRNVEPLAQVLRHVGYRVRILIIPNRHVYIVHVYSTIIARSTSVFSTGFRKFKQYQTEQDKLCRRATASKLREMRRDIGLTRKRVKREALERMASLEGYVTRVDMETIE